MKMQRTIIIRRDYLHFIKKYGRFEKRHTVSINEFNKFQFVFETFLWRVLFLNEICRETDQSETSINETPPTQK